MPFESDLFEGQYFIALKNDKALDSETYREFFHGKARMCQCQWRLRLKRPLEGPLYLGFESNKEVQDAKLPRGTLQSALISILHVFHSKNDLHLRLPVQERSSTASRKSTSSESSETSESRSPADLGSTSNDGGVDKPGEWVLAISAKTALSNFVATPVGGTPPPLHRPLNGQKWDGSQTLEEGFTYSFCWYTQYVDFTDLSLVNLPFLGCYRLPVRSLRMVLFEGPSLTGTSARPVPSSTSKVSTLLGKLTRTAPKRVVAAPLPAASLVKGNCTPVVSTAAADASVRQKHGYRASMDSMIVIKKAKVRSGCEKTSPSVGDIPTGNRVMVLGYGCASDGTSRVKVKGMGLLSHPSPPESDPSAAALPIVGVALPAASVPPSELSKGLSDEKQHGQKKVRAEVTGWMTCSLLRVEESTGVSPSTEKIPEPAADIPATGRTYGFSCRFDRF